MVTLEGIFLWTNHPYHGAQGLVRKRVGHWTIPRTVETPVPDSKSNPIQSIEFTMVAEKMVDGGKNISIRGYLLMAQQALEQRDNNGFSLRIWSLLIQRWRWWGWLWLELAAFLFFFPPCGRFLAGPVFHFCSSLVPWSAAESIWRVAVAEY